MRKYTSKILDRLGAMEPVEELIDYTLTNSPKIKENKDSRDRWLKVYAAALNYAIEQAVKGPNIIVDFELREGEENFPSTEIDQHSAPSQAVPRIGESVIIHAEKYHVVDVWWSMPDIGEVGCLPTVTVMLR